jgi:DHA1 family bicyclomycin/chloramphenicol resistance-like MFS transporter
MIVLGALSAAGPLSHDTYLPGLPDLAKDLGIGTSTAQLTLTASLAGLALGQLVAGPMSDRLGRRRPLIAGATVFAVAALVCGLTSSVPLLIGARFVQGLSGAAGVAVSNAVIRDRHAGERMARELSVLLAISSIAPVVAPVIGGGILTFTSWRGIFGFVAATGAVMALLTAARLEETLPPERRHPGGLHAVRVAFPRLRRDRRFVGYALVTGLSFGAMFAYIAGSPFVVQDIYGASSLEFAAVFAVNGLGIVVVGRATAQLLGRYSMHRLMVAACCQAWLGAAIVLVSWLAHAGIWPLLVGLFLTVSCITALLQNSMTLAMEPYPDIAGSASAIVGVTRFGIGALCAPLVGVAGDGTALPMALVMVGLTSCSLLLALGLQRAHLRTPINTPIPTT